LGLTPGIIGEKVMVEQTIAPLDLERMVELDFVRTTEAAALNAYHWLGKGDPQAAHAAAVAAARRAFIAIKGTDRWSGVSLTVW